MSSSGGPLSMKNEGPPNDSSREWMVACSLTRSRLKLDGAMSTRYRQFRRMRCREKDGKVLQANDSSYITSRSDWSTCCVPVV
jgi:hypothetical protein